MVRYCGSVVDIITRWQRRRRTMAVKKIFITVDLNPLQSFVAVVCWVCWLVQVVQVVRGPEDVNEEAVMVVFIEARDNFEQNKSCVLYS